MEHQTKAK